MQKKCVICGKELENEFICDNCIEFIKKNNKEDINNYIRMWLEQQIVRKYLKKMEVLEMLKGVRKRQIKNKDVEKDHIQADSILLYMIDDDEITKEYKTIYKKFS